MIILNFLTSGLTETEGEGDGTGLTLGIILNFLTSGLTDTEGEGDETVFTTGLGDITFILLRTGTFCYFLTVFLTIWLGTDIFALIRSGSRTMGLFTILKDAFISVFGLYYLFFSLLYHLSC